MRRFTYGLPAFEIRGMNRHTGRRPRRSYRSRFRAERHRRQRGPRDEHGPYGPGHDGWRHYVPRDDGWLFGNDAFDECGIVRSVNTVMGDFLADAEALLAARHERVSLDDIARQAQPNPSIHNTEPITMDDVIIIAGSLAGLAGALHLGR